MNSYFLLIFVLLGIPQSIQILNPSTPEVRDISKQEFLKSVSKNMMSRDDLFDGLEIDLVFHRKDFRETAKFRQATKHCWRFDSGIKSVVRSGEYAFQVQGAEGREYFQVGESRDERTLRIMLDEVHRKIGVAENATLVNGTNIAKLLMQFESCVEKKRDGERIWEYQFRTSNFKVGKDGLAVPLFGRVQLLADRNFLIKSNVITVGERSATEWLPRDDFLEKCANRTLDKNQQCFLSNYTINYHSKFGRYLPFELKNNGVTELEIEVISQLNGKSCSFATLEAFGIESDGERSKAKQKKWILMAILFALVALAGFFFLNDKAQS